MLIFMVLIDSIDIPEAFLVIVLNLNLIRSSKPVETVSVNNGPPRDGFDFLLFFGKSYGFVHQRLADCKLTKVN